MKKYFTVLQIIAIMVIMFGSNSLVAQSNELVVYASANGAPNFLNEVIADNPGFDVYKLVSRDTCYLFSGTITADSDFEIVGELDPATNRPPTIQPYELGDGSVPGTLFNFVGEGTTATISDLYLLSRSNNNTQNLPDAIAIIVAADNITLNLNNCVFDSWAQFAIGYSGNWDKFFIEDCHFRNMVHPTQWYVGEVIRNMWPGTVYTDTLSMVNNTMFCVNGYAAAPVTKYYMKYFQFEHNTVAYTFKNPFFIFNATDAKVNDNIFYANWAGGSSKAEMPWWDQLWSPEVGSVIDLDTLNVAKDSVFAPDLVAEANMRMLAEARRTIDVKNNAYFWPQSITDMWTEWNTSAASDDSIYTHTWMNERTTNMFADDVTWPGLDESGNLDADPGFDNTVTGVVLQDQNGLKDWFELCRGNNLATAIWGFGITEPTGDPGWVPAWPVPENLAYTNTSLQTAGSNGLPVGDLNWFPNVTGVEDTEELPSEFNLANNYPNPFNPSTNINFTIPSTGEVSLKIYDVMGREIKTVLEASQQSAGTYNYSVNMNGFASGIYFYSLQHNGNIQTKKMMLLK
ncbi:MAG: T9SS type A sorting domain-containing protein [Bacteroidetes bacterium]|nr:T9SS type A sorting domain-containing protein [Bacteroidota bacterium]